MRTSNLSFLVLFLLSWATASKAQTYQLSWKLDAPLLAGSFAWAGLSQWASGQVNPLTEDDIWMLNRSNVNSFDRPATYNWSPTAGHISDIGILVGGASIFTTLIPQKGRSEFGTIAVMALEGGFATLGLTNSFKAGLKRTRPFVYNIYAPLDDKLKRDARFSFFSGHTSLTAYGTFFTAKVLHDLFPEARWRYLTWASAAAISATTGYLRVRAGKHFPTDVIAGFAVGAGIGILIPQLHKKKSNSLSLFPTPNGIGMAMRF